MIKLVIKTFNVDLNVYNEFNNYCKELGISMSRQVNLFMKSQIETEPMIRKTYLKKIEKLQKGKFMTIKGDLMDRYN